MRPEPGQHRRPEGHFDNLAVGALWVRVLGLVALVASTVFTLWARFSLGTSWSVTPKVQGDHRLRTHGPYAVTFDGQTG